MKTIRNQKHTDEEIAAWYTKLAEKTPANPPTRREVASYAGVSVSSAQKLLLALNESSRIPPIRKQGRR